MTCVARLTTLLALLVLANAARADDAPARRDPLEFDTPERAPVFFERLKGAEWDKRFAEALAKLGDLGALAKSARPVAGTRVDRVYHDSAAATLKLKPGDVLVKADGTPLDWGDLSEHGLDDEQAVVVVGPRGFSHEATLPSGVLGVATRPVVRPELLYLRQTPRGTAWDAFAVVGAATCRTDPDLAETAWHRAIAAGYVVDAVCEYCGAEIAWRQGRPDDAVAFCAAYDARGDLPAALPHERLSRQVAVGNFKIEQALGGRMAPSPPTIILTEPDSSVWLQTLLAAHRALPDARRAVASPSEVSAFVKLNLLKDMKVWPSKMPASHKDRVEQRDLMAAAKALKWEVPSRRYVTYAALPKEDAPDVELTVRAKIRGTKPVRSGEAAAMAVSLVDGDEPTEPDADGDSENRHHAFLTSWVELWGWATVEQRGDGDERHVAQAVDAGEATGNERPFTLRLIHCSGRDEVWIDRRRLLYLPAGRSPKKVGIEIYMTGLTTEWGMDFQKLDPGQVP